MPSTKDTEVSIRDRRSPGVFYFHNAVIDACDKLSIHAVVVYLVLCRHANNETQQCTLLLSTIAKKSRTSRASVCRGIAELKEANLIEVDNRVNRSSLFTLLQPKLLSEVTLPATPNGTPPVPASQGEMPASPNETHNYHSLNKTKNSPPEVSEGLFEDISLESVIQKEIYPYYQEKCERQLVRLTEKKIKHGMARFRECLSDTKGDIDKAKELMLAAIDAVAESDFLMGRDKKTNGRSYNDWVDHIFGSREVFEKRLNA